MEIRPGTTGKYKLLDEVHLAGWYSPAASDYKHRNQTENWRGEDLVCQAQLTDSGQTPNGSTAPTEKKDVLNPAFSRWLMGLPKEWDDCTPTETQSLRRKQSSS